MERGAGGRIFFPDRPDFNPNLSPREIFIDGSFGGTYWKPIHSRTRGEDLRNQHLEFDDWWRGIPDDLLVSEKYEKSRNKYLVSCGTPLSMWESKGWIREQDPYGWVQWYCRFFAGRRSDDDERQIRRWKAFAGKRGRFRLQLINKIIANEALHDDFSVSPVIRQSLQHWGYRLTVSDFEEESLKKWKEDLSWEKEETF